MPVVFDWLTENGYIEIGTSNKITYLKDDPNADPIKTKAVKKSKEKPQAGKEELFTLVVKDLLNIEKDKRPKTSAKLKSSIGTWIKAKVAKSQKKVEQDRLLEMLKTQKYIKVGSQNKITYLK
jgi:hypothetical protein